MIYKEFPVINELKPYVQVVWLMESESESDIQPPMKIMPDGILEFVTHYSSPWITTVCDEEPEVQPQCFINSQMRKYIELQSKGETGFISVRFLPWGGYHFFDQSVDTFLDNTISGDILWPGKTEPLIRDLQQSPTHNEKAEIVQQYLLKRLQEYRKNLEGFDEIVKLVRESRGLLSVEEICEKNGTGKKQLERRFIKYLGTTPKVFSRICRFLNICNNLEEYRNRTLTELTYECGYYDQSHLIKEFREFSGFTPKEFFEKQNICYADM